MEGISDLCIVGLDEKRPPKMRKEPYINLYFKLSHQAAEDWCKQFNGLVSKIEFRPEIKPKEGLYIETWVRNPDEIPPLLAKLHEAVRACTEEYIRRVNFADAAKGAASDQKGESPEQTHLNQVLQSLKFEKAPE